MGKSPATPILGRYVLVLSTESCSNLLVIFVIFFCFVVFIHLFKFSNKLLGSILHIPPCTTLCQISRFWVLFLLLSCKSTIFNFLSIFATLASSVVFNILPATSNIRAEYLLSTFIPKSIKSS